MLHLETLPHTVFHSDPDAYAFFDDFLSNGLSEIKLIDETLVSLALAVSSRTNARSMDALHLAAAISLGADEFVTTERRTKLMYWETGCGSCIWTTRPPRAEQIARTW